MSFQGPIRITATESHIPIHVKAGSNEQAVVILEGAAGMTHACDVIVEDGARCSVLCMNIADAKTTVKIMQTSRVGSGAVMRWQNVTLGGATVEHDLVSTVEGRDSESAIDWMFYAKGTEKQTLNVRNIFNGANGSGEILMRGIAEQKGHASCRGLIEIGLKGGGTNTYLTQEVLMLDATSKVDAIPSLEIKTNDVKASHSATIARVTEEDLFYFGARGISPGEARKMFVLGFLGDISGRVESEEQREMIVAAIEAKYGR